MNHLFNLLLKNVDSVLLTNETRRAGPVMGIPHIRFSYVSIMNSVVCTRLLIDIIYSVFRDWPWHAGN